MTELYRTRRRHEVHAANRRGGREVGICIRQFKLPRRCSPGVLTGKGIEFGGSMITTRRIPAMAVFI